MKQRNNRAEKLDNFITKELGEHEDLITPAGSFLELNEDLRNDNPDVYLRDFKDVTPEEATRYLGTFDRLYYTIKRVISEIRV